MRWALFPVPPLAPPSGFRIVTPADVTLVVGDMREHRVTVVAWSAVVVVASAPADPAIARIVHGSSLRLSPSVLGWNRS
jgi:hypothetical protein